MFMIDLATLLHSIAWPVCVAFCVHRTVAAYEAFTRTLPVEVVHDDDDAARKLAAAVEKLESRAVQQSDEINTLKGALL